jgi:hypothetical protein
MRRGEVVYRHTSLYSDVILDRSPETYENVNQLVTLALGDDAGDLLLGDEERVSRYACLVRQKSLTHLS